MQAANPYIYKIKPYIPGKPMDEVKREMGLKSVIKLASNENPYPPSPKVLAAIAGAAREINRYPDGGCFLLRRTLARKLNVDEDQLIFGNGSDEIIVLAVKALRPREMRSSLPSRPFWFMRSPQPCRAPVSTRCRLKIFIMILKG